MHRLALALITVIVTAGLPALALAQQFPTPTVTPTSTPPCSPGPGEIANFIVDVETVTSDGFVGPAHSTLGPLTGEVVTVHVTPETQWHGTVQGLEDVQVGMSLQAVGPRQDDCSIVAVNVFSAGPGLTPSPTATAAPAATALPPTGTGPGTETGFAAPAVAALAALVGAGLFLSLASLAARRGRPL